ncbi:MAG: hypothetical protein ACP5I2_02000 [Fervidicoccaceae archaeon]|jgi:hypothetical protein|uniref:Uncharacterized protein n=1 Tax=Fervidicoccus fontis TaxID=683846 RepID=A0A7C2UQX1_9CREN|nr:MAG: hypothetical protein C0179_04910 [Fervidicoccus sp.]HEU98127.1 hypothetical protein [Fervidicoccus fontis]
MTSPEFLSTLVDGTVVKAVYLIRLEEGIVASWPPGEEDGEIESIADLTSVPQRDGLYFVIGGDELKKKYFGIVISDVILLFKVGDEMNAEKIAEKLSNAYILLKKRKFRERTKL